MLKLMEVMCRPVQDQLRVVYVAACFKHDTRLRELYVGI